MPKLKSTKKRVLITIDEQLLKLIKQQDKKVSTLINDVLQMYLLNQYNQQLNELLMLNARFWKGGSFGIQGSNPCLGVVLFYL